MAKKKSSGNNNKKVKLVKRKCANVFKAKSSGRSKYVGKVVDTALRKNLTQAKDVEDSNKEFENVRELLACKKQKQSKIFSIKLRIVTQIKLYSSVHAAFL